MLGSGFQHLFSLGLKLILGFSVRFIISVMVIVGLGLGLGFVLGI